jgi:hypothetical protein
MGRENAIEREKRPISFKKGLGLLYWSFIFFSLEAPFERNNHG